MSLKTHKTKVDMISSISAGLNSTEKYIGLMNEDIPNIKQMFNMFEPIMFPIAIWLFPLMPATTEVISSGKLVPIATIVNPIISWLILKRLAIKTALLETKKRIND